MASHALRLARLDLSERTGAGVITQDETIFQEPSAAQVDELVALLSIVPFNDLELNREPLILNPGFGKSSNQIGGADADLLLGDLLIDLKTTKKDSIDVRWLDQLLGYFLLARNERKHRRTFPEIKRLGFYFARRAFLWVQPVSGWVDHPKFAETEEWFHATALERPPSLSISPDRNDAEPAGSKIAQQGLRSRAASNPKTKRRTRGKSNAEIFDEIQRLVQAQTEKT
jgi:hypothetical protein